MSVARCVLCYLARGALYVVFTSHSAGSDPLVSDVSLARRVLLTRW